MLCAAETGSLVASHAMHAACAWPALTGNVSLDKQYIVVCSPCVYFVRLTIIC